MHRLAVREVKNNVMQKYTQFIFIFLMASFALQAMESSTFSQMDNWQKEAKKLKDAYHKGTASKWYKRAKNAVAQEVPYPEHHEEFDNSKKKLKTIIATQNSIAAVTFLAEKGASYKPALNALHYVATKGYAPFCIFLIETQLAYVSNLDNKQNTPLHSAALAGQEAICALLLKHGAQHGAKNDRQLTPLQKLLLFGHEKSKAACVPLLVQHGAYFDIFRRINLIPDTFYVRLLDFNAQGLLRIFSWGLYKERYQYNSTLFHQFACQKYLTKNSLRLLYAMIFNIGLEQEKKLVRTVLAIRKFRVSLLKTVPRDVLKTCIIPHIMPFYFKKIAACIELQLKIMRSELLQTNDLQKIPLDYMVGESHERFKLYFNPDTVESHREGLSYFNEIIFSL